MNTEEIRKSYCPQRIRLLLVGESPPASGRFFYIRSAVTTYTARAFEAAHATTFADSEEFLHYFKACGCYLDDLSPTPVDNLGNAERESTLWASIDGLAERIHDLNPSVVAIALRKIENHVREAVRRSGRQPLIEVLPFAGNGHQRKYISKLCELITCHVPATT